MCSGAEDADPPAGVLDHGEDIESRSGQGDGLQEVAGQEGVGLGAQEVRPRLEARSGAGSMPASFRISQTVEAATFTPRTRSSPWMRR
jgi:hypothetical protein